MNCGKQSESWLGHDDLFAMSNGVINRAGELVPSLPKKTMDRTVQNLKKTVQDSTYKRTEKVYSNVVAESRVTSRYTCQIQVYSARNSWQMLTRKRCMGESATQ